MHLILLPRRAVTAGLANERVVRAQVARAILRTYAVKLMAVVADQRHNRRPKIRVFGIYIKQVEGKLGTTALWFARESRIIRTQLALTYFY